MFALIAISFPFILLGILELSLRAAHYGRDTSLFAPSRLYGGRYLAAGEFIATRYFPSEQFPPTAPSELFLAEKPARGIRIFAFGESSAAGFPYPPNALFTRIVSDALRDALPSDTVEVINLGIAATNSYAIVDMVDEVLDQKPDAVLIYAGHNEYYGALGIGSTESLGAFPAFVRLYLRLQRLKTFVLLRNGIKAAFSVVAGNRTGDETSASRMESVARDQRIVLGSRTYLAGVAQYESNLAIVLSRFRKAGVPVFVGSLVSNLRDQEPLSATSDTSHRGGAAKFVFDSAAAELSAGHDSSARVLYERARDLDFVRFRAPSDFNRVVRKVAAKTGAIYVPVAEAFSAKAEHGVVGHDLVLEHVHPNKHGYALLGMVFVNAIKGSGIFPNADFSRLRSPEEYEGRMALTRFDDLIALHEVRTVTSRWPFVPFSKQRDYRGTYRPSDFVDSLAFFVSRGGIGWSRAKTTVAEHYERTEKPDSAVLEYDGLIRNFPHDEAPLRLAARVLLAANRGDEAIPYLERAIAIQPTAYSYYALGVLALRKRDTSRAIRMLESSLRLTPSNPDGMYQLSFAYALQKNAEQARAVALALYRVAPNYPGLREWLTTLGLTPP